MGFCAEIFKEKYWDDKFLIEYTQNVKTVEYGVHEYIGWIFNRAFNPRRGNFHIPGKIQIFQSIVMKSKDFLENFDGKWKFQ